MITEKQLLTSKKYKYKHIQLNVIEKDDQDQVLVFSAAFVTTKVAGQMSDGHIEINRTLWEHDQRPQGYWFLGSPEKDGVMTSFFVTKEWIEKTSLEEQKNKRIAWGIDDPPPVD